MKENDSKNPDEHSEERLDTDKAQPLVTAQPLLTNEEAEPKSLNDITEDSDLTKKSESLNRNKNLTPTTMKVMGTILLSVINENLDSLMTTGTKRKLDNEPENKAAEPIHTPHRETKLELVRSRD